MAWFSCAGFKSTKDRVKQQTSRQSRTLKALMRSSQLRDRRRLRLVPSSFQRRRKSREANSRRYRMSSFLLSRSVPSDCSTKRSDQRGCSFICCMRSADAPAAAARATPPAPEEAGAEATPVGPEWREGDACFVLVSFSVSDALSLSESRSSSSNPNLKGSRL